MVTVKEQLDEILNELKRVSGVDSSAIISRDGLLMTSAIPSEIRAETFAAMSATMLGAAETASMELKKGFPERVIVESQNCRLIVAGAGSKALLVVMTDPSATLGLILVSMGKAVERIKEIIK
jgi:hypothetical protein